VGAGKRVLDLGCGTGSFALPIAAAGNRVTGLDYSPAMLRVFQRKLPATSDIRLVHGRIEDADLPPHDVILIANALYRIADIEPVIARLAALATEGVIVVWSVGRPPAWKEEARRRIRPGRYQPGVDYIHLAAALWAAGYHPAIDMVTVPVEEHYANLDDAATALLDWADPHPDEVAAARAAARDLFIPSHDGLRRQTAAAIAIVRWEPAR
jgi:SAM-dependent methyltransferase